MSNDVKDGVVVDEGKGEGEGVEGVLPGRTGSNYNDALVHLDGDADELLHFRLFPAAPPRSPPPTSPSRRQARAPWPRRWPCRPGDRQEQQPHCLIGLTHLGELSAWLACVAYAGESVFSGIGGDIDAMDLPVSFHIP